VSSNVKERGTDLEHVRLVVESQSRAAELAFHDVRPAGCRRGRCRRGGHGGFPSGPRRRSTTAPSSEYFQTTTL